jgi:ATP-dependent RNA helicase RhlE
LTLPSFAALGLAEPLSHAVDAQGFRVPTPIQAGAIPWLLEGRDLLGIAQTGTGKTAAFALPILQRLSARSGRARPFGTRALILAPTRELALQIEAAIRPLGSRLRLSTAVILGGVGRRPQEERMRRGPDIVIGTPGRICDLLSTQHLRLDEVVHFVLDEADRMLDLGFIRDIRRVMAALPTERQSMLFSATMPAEVEQLARSFLRNPKRIEIAPELHTPSRIEQHVHFVPTAGKRALLVQLLSDPALERVIVFTRTKRGANRVAEQLEAVQIRTEALHGNKSQAAREKSLQRFRSGHARVLVATDIASRGIDINGISHVINFDLPADPASYVHRIGRTARAGAQGIAISFCDDTERATLRAIERCVGTRLAIAGGVPDDAEPPVAPGPRRHAGLDRAAGRIARRARPPEAAAPPVSRRCKAWAPEAGGVR